MDINAWEDNIRQRVRSGLPLIERPDAKATLAIIEQRHQEQIIAAVDRIDKLLVDATTSSIEVSLNVDVEVTIRIIKIVRQRLTGTGWIIKSCGPRTIWLYCDPDAEQKLMQEPTMEQLGWIIMAFVMVCGTVLGSALFIGIFYGILPH